MKSWRGASGGMSLTSSSDRARASATRRSHPKGSADSSTSRTLAGAPASERASVTRPALTTPHDVSLPARKLATRTTATRRRGRDASAEARELACGRARPWASHARRRARSRPGRRCARRCGRGSRSRRPGAPRAARRLPAADGAVDGRLADPPARVLPFEVVNVAVVEDSHLRGETGAPRELAHRGPADLAHRELVQVRVAKLRDAEVETPAVSVDGRRYEAAMLQHLEKIRDARPRRGKAVGELARGQAVLATLDEQHEHIECSSGGACDRPFLSHGA